MAEGLPGKRRGRRRALTPTTSCSRIRSSASRSPPGTSCCGVRPVRHHGTKATESASTTSASTRWWATKAAIYRWTWQAPTAAAFVGVPTNGKVPGARGITFHIYDADGRIKREESFWDCATAVRDLNLPSTHRRRQDSRPGLKGTPMSLANDHAQAWVTALIPPTPPRRWACTPTTWFTTTMPIPTT